MSIEHELQESIEDGVEKGIVKAVKKLIHKGLVEEITQEIIDVVVLNICKCIDSQAIIEMIHRIVSKLEFQQINSLIFKILEGKYAVIEDEELKTEINKIDNFYKLEAIIKNILEFDSLEELKDCIKKINLN